MALWIIPLAVLLLIVVAYFATNRAASKRIADRHGGDMEEWPDWMRVREIPKVA